MNRIYGLAATGMSLVALYLILVNAAGARKLVGALATGTSDIYRTLQARA